MWPNKARKICCDYITGHGKVFFILSDTITVLRIAVSQDGTNPEFRFPPLVFLTLWSLLLMDDSSLTFLL
jgi:hypothetical protein